MSLLAQTSLRTPHRTAAYATMLKTAGGILSSLACLIHRLILLNPLDGLSSRPNTHRQLLYR
jgi:hypothetical protein